MICLHSSASGPVPEVVGASPRSRAWHMAGSGRSDPASGRPSDFATSRGRSLPGAGPRTTTDTLSQCRATIAATLALQAAGRALLVVPAELRATAAAARVAATISMHCDDVSVVVRGPAPGKLRPRDVAKALNLPLAGSLRPEPAMCQALERGEAPTASGTGPLAELCKRIIGDLTSGRRAEAAA